MQVFKKPSVCNISWLSFPFLFKIFKAKLVKVLLNVLRAPSTLCAKTSFTCACASCLT